MQKGQLTLIHACFLVEHCITQQNMNNLKMIKHRDFLYILLNGIIIQLFT